VAKVIYLDTHVVAWLYGIGPSSLSPRATETIDGADEVRCSPIVRLELHYPQRVW
jgi:PIN domain nuclease of toxin-antitoxin system